MPVKKTSAILYKYVKINNITVKTIFNFVFVSEEEWISCEALLIILWYSPFIHKFIFLTAFWHSPIFNGFIMLVNIQTINLCFMSDLLFVIHKCVIFCVVGYLCWRKLTHWLLIITMLNIRILFASGYTTITFYKSVYSWWTNVIYLELLNISLSLLRESAALESWMDL